jgi:Flp pilus assembly protein TadD
MTWRAAAGAALLAGLAWAGPRADTGPADDLVREGLRLSREGKANQALEKLRQAAALHNRHFSAHLALGMTALENQRYDEARTALVRAAELDASSAAPHYGLGLLHEKLGQWDKARQAWSKCAEQSQDPSLREMAQRHLDRLSP